MRGALLQDAGPGGPRSQTWQLFSLRLLVPSFCWVSNLDIGLPEQSGGRAQSAPPKPPPSGPFLENLVLKTLDEREQGAAHPDNGWREPRAQCRARRDPGGEWPKVVALPRHL